MNSPWSNTYLDLLRSRQAYLREEIEALVRTGSKLSSPEVLEHARSLDAVTNKLWRIGDRSWAADPARPQTGQHLLHLHADPVHFCVAATTYIERALHAGACVRFLLPDDLSAALRDAAACHWGFKLPVELLSQLPALADTPGALRAQLQTATARVQTAGHPALWLVVSVPQGLPDPDDWYAYEILFSELCRSLPMSILCMCGTESSEQLRRLESLPPVHTAYFIAGRAEPPPAALGGFEPRVDSRRSTVARDEPVPNLTGRGALT